MYFRFLKRRLQNVGLSREHARSLAAYFDYQVKCQGYNGACAFFKRIGDTIVTRLSNSGQKPRFVGTAFRYPRKLVFLREYPVDVQLKVCKVARAIRYTEFRKEQVEKVLNGVLAPYNGTTDGIDLLSSLVKLGLQGLSIPEFRPRAMPQIGRQFRKVQSVSGKTPLTLHPPIAESLELLKGTIFTDLPNIKTAFLPLSSHELIYSDDYFVLQRSWPEVVGEIHAAQEGGGKLRMFASPYTVYQTALTPLHEWLAGFRSQLITDCTHDQRAGAVWAQDLMKSGEEVASVDLQTATCRFPLEAQIELLRLLGIPEIWIECLLSVCRGKWLVSKDLRTQANFPKYLTWKVGQPLGIRPSMSLFSTAHNLLLRGLCLLKGLNPDTSFRILGDDGVMVKELYALYCATMTSAGVPISWSKTHVSNRFAEFAGYSITPDVMVRPGQWREATPMNFIELAEWAGAPLKNEVSPVMEEIQKLVLFRAGLYDPEPCDWHKYLRASSRVTIESLESPAWITNGTTWTRGFKTEARAQLGDRVRFFPGVENDEEAFRSLRHLSTTQYYLNLLEYLDWFSPNQLISFGLSAIYDAIGVGEITWLQASELIRALSEDVSRLTWAPPNIQNGGMSGSKLRKFSSILSESSDVNWRAETVGL